MSDAHRSPIPAARVAGSLLRRAGLQLPFDVEFWDGSTLRAASAEAAVGVLHLRRRAVGRLLREPNQLGLTRAFVSGDMDFDGNLEQLLAQRGRFHGASLSAGEAALAALGALVVGGTDAIRRPPPPASELRGRGRRHSLDRDRIAVRHHYDVSNAFYRRLLGPSLVYSCAYFASPDESLEAAQERKLELVCQKLRLQAGERLLDIGAGWGSLLLHAARHHGARGVGITLSEPQAAHESPTTARSTTGRTTRSPASAWSSTSASRTSAPTRRGSPGCCGPAGCCSTTGSRACSPTPRATSR
jgi:cyclopropane-fatty-acyl-phospholipid synthase